MAARPAQVAIVTGGASGIGRATSKRLASDGFEVHILDLDLDGAEQTVEAITSAGGSAVAHHVDLTDPDGIATTLAQVREQASTPSVLVNNAGYMHAGTLPDTDPEAWQLLLDVNLTAIYHLCRVVIPWMVEAGHGIIVNIASAGALVGIKDRAAYCATKAGVVGLTRCIAADHAMQGIRANAICPGTTETEWTQRLLADDPDREAIYARMSARQLDGKLGQPEEIAGAISFLAGPDARFVNGTAFAVDGGMTAV